MDEERPLHLVPCFELREQAVGVVDVPRSFDLGDHDHLETPADLADEPGDVVEEPRTVEAVEPRPEGRAAEVDVAANLHQAFARLDLPVGRDGVLEVAEEDVRLRGDLGELGRHLRIGRVEKVDAARGFQRNLAHRLRGAEGERFEEVARAAHEIS